MDTTPPSPRLPRFDLRSLALPHLSSSDRLGEMLCGLVAVLTFTLLAGPQVDEGRKGVLQLLAGTAGCCGTWGLIDGVLYVMEGVAERARRGRIARAVREADEAEATRLVRDEIEVFLAQLGVPDHDGEIVRYLRARVGTSAIPGPRVLRDDWLGGIAIFCTQMFCCLPAIVPFLVLDDPDLALRLSNVVLVLMLCGVGFQWAAEVGARRTVAALASGLVGLVVVAISIALGP
jgi:hypothetical protein